MRTLAIDLGARRIGLAMSDEGGRWATPLEVLTVTDPAQAIGPVVRRIAVEAVRRLVVGLPLHMDDSFGSAAAAAVKWGRAVHAAAADGDLQLIFVDERLSSFSAEQQLNDRKRAGEKLTRGRRKQQLDAVAAAGFLQEFLDGKLKPIDVPP